MLKDTYKVRGGVPLKGSLALSGAKNASIKLMIASCLFDGQVDLVNIPENADNQEVMYLLDELGVKGGQDGHKVRLNADSLSQDTVSLLFGSKIRSSFLLFGPLLRRFGKAHIPNPGGCRIGARPIERISQGLQALGVNVAYNHETGYYDATLDDTVSGEYTFEKPTHTGTETLILASVCGGGKVTLNNCALEPEIDDLIAFLNNAGARIERSDKTIFVESVKSLRQQSSHTVIEDRNEAVTYAAMAYATGGDITLTNIRPHLIKAFTDKLQEAGGDFEILDPQSMRFYSNGKRLKAVSIQTGPHPGYMTDWQPQWGLLMATAHGECVIHETMLEARLNYVKELKKVGAKMKIFQPEVDDPSTLYQFNYNPKKSYQQAVRIKGVKKLHNGVMQVHDIRAGATVLMAALGAQGESVLIGVSQIERGYDHLLEKITKLGGKIVKV